MDLFPADDEVWKAPVESEKQEDLLTPEDLDLLDGHDVSDRHFEEMGLGFADGVEELLADAPDCWPPEARCPPVNVGSAFNKAPNKVFKEIAPEAWNRVLKYYNGIIALQKCPVHVLEGMGLGHGLIRVLVEQWADRRFILARWVVHRLTWLNVWNGPKMPVAAEQPDGEKSFFWPETGKPMPWGGLFGLTDPLQFQSPYVAVDLRSGANGDMGFLPPPNGEEELIL